MPTDSASIAPLLSKIEAAASAFLKTGNFPNDTERLALIRGAEQLAIAAREQEENLYFTATQNAQNAAIRCAIGMGIFEALPSTGQSTSAESLARKLDIDRQLIVRVMRACTSTHMFNETGEATYSHNPLSLAFAKSSNRDMFKQMYDFAGKGVYALPEFLASTGYKHAGDYSDGSFQLGHSTSLGIWEFLKEDPERLKVFNSGMQSLATIGNNKSAGSYPFDRQLGETPCSPEEVLIVDIGGGRGQALEAIKENFPELKGRMILEDLPNVIEEAKASGLPPFIETRAASFFEPQSMHGARAYHFRRIFHDWGDSKSTEILANVVAAMTPESRLLIADTVVPAVGSPRDLALQDLNMMSFGGMERTQRQWEGLLTSCGLRLIKVWSEDNSKHAMIEAILR